MRNNERRIKYSFAFWISTKLCSNYRKLQFIGLEFLETKCDNEVNWFICMVCQKNCGEKLLLPVELTGMQMRCKKDEMFCSEDELNMHVASETCI